MATKENPPKKPSAIAASNICLFDILVSMSRSLDDGTALPMPHPCNSVMTGAAPDQSQTV
jgi:hypothetical protein